MREEWRQSASEIDCTLDDESCKYCIDVRKGRAIFRTFSLENGFPDVSFSLPNLFMAFLFSFYTFIQLLYVREKRDSLIWRYYY